MLFGNIRAQVVSLLLMAVVCLAPLPLGSVNPIAIAIWCAVMGLALIFADLSCLNRPSDRFFIAAVAVIVASYACVLHEQLAAEPWFAAMHPIWARAATALDATVAPSAAITRNQAWYALGSPLLCLLSLSVGYIVGCDRRAARRLVWSVALSGGLYAAVAIVSFIIDPGTVLGFEKLAHAGNLTTPFLNRNTAAVYFGVCATAAAMLFFDRQAGGPDGWLWRAINFLRARAPLRWPERSELAAMAACGLCLVAMLLTSSRAGVVLSTAGLVLACALVPRGRDGRRGRFVLLLLAGVGLALLLLQTIGSGVSARFDEDGLSIDGRLGTYRATIVMIESAPAFGTGLGTFAAAFPAFRLTESSPFGIWDRAHNTILEIAADTGLPLAILVALAWCAGLLVLLHGIRRRRRDRLFAITALAVAVIAICHSLIDFSLQIPGFAVMVTALFGMGLAQSYSFSSHRQQINART